MKNINAYLGKYRVFSPIDYNTNKSTTNENDTYLLGKSKCECYRYSDSTLAIYFQSGVAVANKTILLLEELGVNITLIHDLDGESVYHMDENMIHIAHKILKFQTKGKNIKPKSIRTARRQNK